MANVPLDHQEDEEPLTPEQETALQESIDQIERGECVTAEEMLAELRAMHKR